MSGTPAGALGILAILLAGPPLRAGEAVKFQHRDFQGPEACAQCHPRHYQEWRGSPHAYSTVDPLVQACNRLALEETGGKIGSFCVNCHAPLGTRTGEVQDALDGKELSALVRSGVSCEVCHKMGPLPPGKPIANAGFELSAGSVFNGPIKDPVSASPSHESAVSDTIDKSPFCGICHDVAHNSALLEKTFAQWSASPYTERIEKCQDCHMLRYSGQAAVGGPYRETLRRHNFPAVTVPLTAFPNRGLQLEQVQEFLRTAIRLAVFPPRAARAGADLEFTVKVKNVGAGHNIPTGISNERQMWIEATVLDSKGATLFASGVLDEHGDLGDRHPGSSVPADPALVSFADRFLDERGEEVTFIWQAARVDERSIKPFEERSATYRAPVPPSLAGQRVRLRVRVLLRPFAPQALRKLGLARLIEKLPIWEMAAFESEDIPVYQVLPRRVEHRVPGDFPDLLSAVDGARDGDTVLVGPGEQVLPRPLDFGGKKIRVRSQKGAELTVLRLRAGPAAAGGSVVVFQGGEGPDSVLEGFTITGGRGTEAGGVRRGGGIYISRSSPTVSANIIIENDAGEGGGIFCRDGRPVIDGNQIHSCRARRGGGLALVGGGELEGVLKLRGCSIQGNIAGERGGGAYLDGGRIAVERCVVAGNIAGAEGGGLSASARTDLAIDRATFAQNRAAAGGALFTEPPATARVTSSILWDNAPPGCAAPACSAAISYSILDQKVEAGSTNKNELPIFFDSMGYWEKQSSPPGDGPGDGTGGAGRTEEIRKWQGGDYRVRPLSPAIDAGDPGAPADPDDSRADMGAYFLEKPLNAFVRADVDGDGQVELRDLALLLQRLCLHRELRCLDAADVNDDGRVDCLDAVSLSLYLILGRPRPAAPFGACGLDPTPGEGLSCEHKADPCRG
jgi:cytochrome c554/c'-like protein/dockerin type I repeat protein